MTRIANYEITAEDRTQKAFQSVQRGLGGLGKAAIGLKSALATVIGVGGLLTLTHNAMNAADKIDELSIRLGASTESLSQYQYVAQLTGVSFETLTQGWQTMTRSISEAAMGTGKAKNALLELGLNAQSLKQLAPEKQFELLADAFQGVENHSDKVRLAMKLFGTEGVSLLQTMEGGSGAIQAMRAEADALGLTLDKSTATQMALANDNIDKLKQAFKGLTMQLAIHLGPALGDIAKWLSEHLPVAIAIAQAGILRLKLLFNEMMTGITQGLSQFYQLLGKLPGSLGEPHRQAATYLQGLNTEFAKTTQMHTQTLQALQSGNSTQPAPILAYQKVVEDASDSLEHLQALQAKPLLAPKQEDSNLRALQQRGASWTERTLTPLERYQAEQAELNQLLQAGTLTQETYHRAMQQVTEGYRQASQPMGQMENQMVSLQSATTSAAQSMQHSFADYLFDPFQNGVEGMLGSFSSALKRMAAEGAAMQLFSGAKSGLSSFFGGGMKLPGFATGGQFTVGGLGGTDSQLVAFRATPGEQVSVKTPNQQTSAKSMQVTNHIHIAAPQGQITQQSLNQLQSKLYTSMQQAAQNYR
jgi:hypothetical protein